MVMEVMFGDIIFIWGRANSSHYIHATFCGDKYKLHHQKLMQTVLGLAVSKCHIPSLVLVYFS